jgi:hypothetical protein
MRTFIWLALIVLPWPRIPSQEQRPYRIEVLAAAVARDRVFSELNAGDEKQEAYILRVNEPADLRRELRYIKLYYQHRSDEPLLPKDFFGEGKKIWRLTIARVYGCDGTVRKMATLYNEKREPIFNAELLPHSADPRNPEPVPLDVVLPCFLLETKYVPAMKIVN